jgi:hypothetical protein
LVYNDVGTWGDLRVYPISDSRLSNEVCSASTTNETFREIKEGVDADLENCRQFSHKRPHPSSFVEETRMEERPPTGRREPTHATDSPSPIDPDAVSRMLKTRLTILQIVLVRTPARESRAGGLRLALSREPALSVSIFVGAPCRSPAAAPWEAVSPGTSEGRHAAPGSRWHHPRKPRQRPVRAAPSSCRQSLARSTCPGRDPSTSRGRTPDEARQRLYLRDSW